MSSSPPLLEEGTLTVDLRYAHEWLEAMPDGVLVVDRQERIVLANSRAAMLFSYAPADLPGTPLAMLLPEPVRARHSKWVAGYLAAPKARPMGAERDLRAQRRDGSQFPVDISLSPLETAGGLLVIAAVRNISDRIAMESSLRRSEEKYRLLVDNASEVLYQVGLEADPLRGRVELVSRQSEAITGRTEAEFLADPGLWLELVHPEDRDTLLQSTRTILTSRQPGTRTYRIRHCGTGDYRWVEDRVIPRLDSNGTVVGYQGVARDITERRRTEQDRARLEAQLQKAQRVEAVGRLAGGIAHDFNNMLTVILGNTQSALLGLRPDDPVREELVEINEAARRSADLTGQLLAFSRQQAIAPRVLNLSARLKGMERLLPRLIEEGITLTFTLLEGVWPVHVDPSQVDQIVTNLVVNAKDAVGEQGAITIETSNVTLDEAYCSGHLGFVPGEYALLTVSDTGCGMDPATLEHVFEPFFTTKPEGKGTGLGLPTVYGIVKQNHGFISIYSEPGQGTTVRIYLPRHQGEEARPEEPHPALSPGRGQETVLLVEDNLAVQRLARKLLERLGYEVLAASTPDQGLALMDEHGPRVRLLITDLVMPQMNGVELADRVAARWPNVKTLFMSGYAGPVASVRDVVPRGSAFLQKPFNLETLARQVREALQR